MPDTQEIEAGQVPARDSEKKLTPKQERFVQEYLIDLNATQAAIRAGYSAATANRIASNLLSNVVIKAKISQKQAKITEKLGITQERVVAELAALAFSDITAVTRIKNGSFSILDTDEWEPYSRANVKSIRETTTEAGGSLSCEMHDKLTALKLLGSHLGMWKEKDADGNKGSSSIDLDSVRRLVREVRK